MSTSGAGSDVISNELKAAAALVLGLGVYVGSILSSRMSKALGDDVLLQWGPVVSLILVAGFVAHRGAAKAGGKEDFWHPRYTAGTFPPVFITALGSFAVHEFLMKAMEQRGGLTGWVPLLLLTSFTGLLALHGARAAETGKFDLKALGTWAVLATVYFQYFVWVVPDLPVVPEEPADASLMKKAAKKGKKAKEAVQQKITKQEAPKGPEFEDTVLTYLPYIAAAVIAAVLATNKMTKSRLVPEQALSGPFPWCVMVAGCVSMFNAIYRQTYIQEGAQFNDLLPILGLTAFTGVLASYGVKIQG